VLLFNHADVFTQQRLIESSHPPQTLFADVWDALYRVESFDRGVQVLAAQVGANEFEVSAVLKQFERAGKLSRGGRGEGRWGIQVQAGANPLGPKSAEARAVLAAVLDLIPAGASGSTELYLLARSSGLDEERVRHALGLLERAGTVSLKKPFSGRAMECLQKVPFHELGMDLSRVRAQERQALLLLKRMTDYAYQKHCRRQFILRYFGENEAARACGGCDVCIGGRMKVEAAPAASSADRVQAPFGAPETFSILAAEELKRFRRELSKDLALPSYLIFNDATMYALAAALPITQDEFLRVRGAGDATWERFGPKIVEICLMARAAGHEPRVVAATVRRRRR